MTKCKCKCKCPLPPPPFFVFPLLQLLARPPAAPDLRHHLLLVSPPSFHDLETVEVPHNDAMFRVRPVSKLQGKCTDDNEAPMMMMMMYSSSMIHSKTIK